MVYARMDGAVSVYYQNEAKQYAVEIKNYVRAQFELGGSNIHVTKPRASPISYFQDCKIEPFVNLRH